MDKKNVWFEISGELALKLLAAWLTLPSFVTTDKQFLIKGLPMCPQDLKRSLCVTETKKNYRQPQPKFWAPKKLRKIFLIA